ncbi:MAG TPA: hypothetical protein VEU11_07230 [Terriglobales bacterium]|nr:hypothetical protein [Terriglobales bacterium]
MTDRPALQLATPGQNNSLQQAATARNVQRGVVPAQLGSQGNYSYGPVRTAIPDPSQVLYNNWQVQDPNTMQMNYMFRQAELYRQAEERDRVRRRIRLTEEDLLPQAGATPDAPDQSELLKNSKDPDFILRNFRTMWVDARGAEYFSSDQMKAALGQNKQFRALNIRIVDDPRVADVLLRVGYTFAWDYPFQLKHQNTSIVLLAGKGEGPLSGPLGAADVARVFVNMAKQYRSAPEKAKK